MHKTRLPHVLPAEQQMDELFIVNDQGRLLFSGPREECEAFVAAIKRPANRPQRWRPSVA